MSAGQALGSARAQIGRRKQIRALDLRSIGFTLEAIAASLLPCDDHRPNGRHSCDYCLPMYGSRAAASRAVDAALRAEYATNAGRREEYLLRQLAQIDLVLRRAMPEAIDKSNPDRNEAARVVERFLRQRARLLGLEAPARVQITTELDESIRQLVEELEGAGVDTAAHR